MGAKPHLFCMADPESSAEYRAVELASQFYEVLLRFVPASTTLGELAVLTAVAKGVYLQRPTTVQEVARSTGLSRWSVSRSILRFIESGWITERKDPNDSRKNLLVWTEQSFEGNRAWSREWMKVWAAMER
jgi:DNA-binding MarR family transcriptional regulator